MHEDESFLQLFTAAFQDLLAESVTRNASFIPVGANLPITSPVAADIREHATHTIGVFNITGGQPGASETEVILAAVRHASQTFGRLHLSVIGRCAELREVELKSGLKDLPVELSVEGVVEPEGVVQKLSACDV